MFFLAASPPFFQFVIYLLIALIVFALVYWLVGRFLPEPIKGWAQVAVIVIGALILVYLLWGLAESGPPHLGYFTTGTVYGTLSNVNQ